MITTTAAFDTAIVGTSRKCYGKVVFDILDTDAAADAVATVTGEAAISQKTQIFNGTREMDSKYATLENDYWLLDGSFSLAPKSTETTYEAGWWSAALSGSDGTFSTPQVVTIDFDSDHSSIGISISFDVMSDEYAEDFTIVVKDSGGSTLHTETVTGNTLSKYIFEENLTNYRQVIITITKWVNGYRMARIAEIDFGIVEEYTGNELIKFNVVEELDTISNTLTSNELTFTVDNQDLRFNILNPTGIYPYLQRNQKIYPYIGVLKADTNIEYIPMGVYYLTEWKSDEGTLTASFTARDILDLLAQDDYLGNSFSGQTLKSIAEYILYSYDLSFFGDFDYVVDSALDSITVTAIVGGGTYREVLQLVCLAGMAVMYSDRYGVIQIKQLGAVSCGETIDFDNMFNAPVIKLDKLVNTVRIVKSNSDTYTYEDPLKPTTEQTIAVKTEENSVITNDTDAENTAIWMLGELNKRFLYETNWRQNPKLEAGDIVTIEDEFGEDKDVRITKQEFSFAGYLSGKTYGRGGS